MTSKTQNTTRATKADRLTYEMREVFFQGSINLDKVLDPPLEEIQKMSQDELMYRTLTVNYFHLYYQNTAKEQIADGNIDEVQCLELVRDLNKMRLMLARHTSTLRQMLSESLADSDWIPRKGESQLCVLWKLVYAMIALWERETIDSLYIQTKLCDEQSAELGVFLSFCLKSPYIGTFTFNKQTDAKLPDDFVFEMPPYLIKELYEKHNEESGILPEMPEHLKKLREVMETKKFEDEIKEAAEDGTIFDPTPDPEGMGIITAKQNLDKSKLSERRYEPYKGRKKTNALKRLNNFLDEKLQDVKELGVEDMELGHNFEYLKSIDYKCEGNCFWNCRAWSKDHPSIPHKIQYGKCGWATTDGGVWYEWG